MKKLKFLNLILIPFLAGCDFLSGITGKNTEQAGQNQESGGDQPEPPLYEKWDTKTVDDLVKEGLGIHTTYSVPAYDKCIGIEYDGDPALLEGYFGIYIQTEFEECEMLYSEILEENNWILKDKMEDFCIAFSPDYSLMLEYIYEANNRELVIYVTKGALVDWPTELVSEAVTKVNADAITVIPEFEAEFYQVNYYDFINAAAINGFGPEEGALVDYRVMLELDGWVTSIVDENSYKAVSPNFDIRIDFYYDISRDEFNIDIFTYIAAVDNWPTEEINTIVAEIEAEGTILPYLGENKGFTVDDRAFPPAVLIETSTKDTSSLVDEYNQYLLDSGYIVYGTLYGEPIYFMPGTTLGYRATKLSDYYVTIEFINIDCEYIVKS